MTGSSNVTLIILFLFFPTAGLDTKLRDTDTKYRQPYTKHGTGLIRLIQSLMLKKKVPAQQHHISAAFCAVCSRSHLILSFPMLLILPHAHSMRGSLLVLLLLCQSALLSAAVLSRCHTRSTSHSTHLLVLRPLTSRWPHFPLPPLTLCRFVPALHSHHTSYSASHFLAVSHPPHSLSSSSYHPLHPLHWSTSCTGQAARRLRPACTSWQWHCRRAAVRWCWRTCCRRTSKSRTS